jgi:hypothetical protein
MHIAGRMLPSPAIQVDKLVGFESQAAEFHDYIFYRLSNFCLIFFYISNQQSQYRMFHKLMCWHSLTFRLPNVISPLQR